MSELNRKLLAEAFDAFADSELLDMDTLTEELDLPSDVKIDSAVFEQATRYNAVVKARYIILTNGMEHYCYEFSDEGYLPLNSFPKLG